MFFPLCITLLIYVYFLVQKKELKLKKLLKECISLVIIMLVFSWLPPLLGLQISKLYVYWEVNSIEKQLEDKNSLTKLDIKYETEDLIKRIKELKVTPKILGVNENTKSDIISIIVSYKNNKSGFYESVLVVKAVKNVNKTLKVNAPVLILPDDTLVINELDKNNFETISPPLARLMVSGKFNPLYIKEEPSVELMSRQEYMKFREDQINEDIKSIDNLISEANKIINAYYGRINEAKNKISFNQTEMENSRKLRESQYEYCKNAGYYSYYFGEFYRYYSDSECESQRSEWDEIIEQFKKNISDWQDALQQNQYWLGETQKDKDILIAYKEIVASQKDTTPSELGLFEPPSTVKVVLESVSDKALADYFATLVHEYLHYSSYVSKERVLPRFFEEGITEYYSRKVVKDQLGTVTNLGYPVFVPVIEKIAADLTEKELESIYFTKDHDRLISLLNEKYGSKFYEETEYYFNIIGYLPADKALKTANNILFKIGGEEIEEKDLYSTNSEYKSSTLIK
ncbi:hypothetical protein A2W32_01665 [candidate division WWE3 bacterium RBG_16_37_10]|uniref:Uncharacterized protein n=1 Tax=candidate division WWE3 bacterium RBG_16_37_10 TaxID=1802610 RepID=A0A1F4UT21_UNCKA|nr:MAG: hypothetical protein A2W32_01665 [candidate division WWE3 bacterium RBG_16_37_10]